MKIRVLIVDDEPDVNLAVKIALEQKDYEVDAFKDPLLALKNFRKGLYDLLILDIKMPKMHGFELYREIKKIDDRVKVCFLTAGEMSLWRIYRYISYFRCTMLYSKANRK